jgi:hypothetical protein
MRGWKPEKNRGKSGARKTQRAAGDHSVGKVRQRKGPAAKASSMAYGKLQAERPVRDNIVGPMKGD